MWREEFPDDDLVLVTRSKHRAADRGDLPQGITLRESSLWPQALFAALAVQRVARDEGADAVLTHNFAVRTRDAVSSIYLHDVLFETNPEMFTPVERLYFSLMTRWARFADLVFTSSESEAQRITAHTFAQRVIPVGLGLSRELTAAGASEESYPGLVPLGYLLTVGRLNFRKNLERTILAALDSGKLTDGIRLVVVGSPDGKVVELNPRVQAAIDSGRVLFTGFVSEAQLRWLYRNTSLFVFLSLAEGFGMPPVEAAYFGAPILASDLPVMHENLGAMARYVSPTDTTAIARAMAEEVAVSAFAAPRADASAAVAARHDWASSVAAMRAQLAAAALKAAA